MTHTISEMDIQQKRPENVTVQVARAQRNPIHFAPLYDRFIKPIYRYIYSRVMNPHDADDLTAQTFLSALEALPRYKDKGYFSAWLFSIARGKLVDHFRRNKHLIDFDERDADMDQADMLADLIQSQEIKRLAAMITNLEDAEKDLIRLRYVADLTFAEMAAVLGKKEDTIKKALYRLLAHLQHLMEVDHA